ncbi:ferredoxin [Microlunatus parietis]|uniref:Ferredoxin n=1 Tax=Microlunatus parietis TaxID=682979 RepID=A0A7Y9LAJ8_9ACTN|nr:ferredoxin [Microlunatus parietis]NYE69868.1 ferredoxin [Microlunatus parietis]
MKVVTTPETCIAAQQCSKLAPNVFGHTADGGFVEVRNPQPSDPADQQGARDAEQYCPSGTIHVIEETSPEEA